MKVLHFNCSIKTNQYFNFVREFGFEWDCSEGIFIPTGSCVGIISTYKYFMSQVLYSEYVDHRFKICLRM